MVINKVVFAGGESGKEPEEKQKAKSLLLRIT
jgi:hypothetical protein